MTNIETPFCGVEVSWVADPTLRRVGRIKF
jgi:hypothetical protein